MLRLAVFSEQHLLRAGLRCLLKSWGVGEIVLECGSRGDFPALVARANPEVAIVSLNADFDLALLTQLRTLSPNCRLLLLTAGLTPELLYHISELGGIGVLNLLCPVDTFLEYLEAVSQGRCSIDPTVYLVGSPAGRVALTKREGELVGLLTHGLKNKEIATALNISEGTVKVYLSRLFQKLKVKDRFELALFGLRNLTTVGAALPVSSAENGEGLGTSLRGPLILDWDRGRMDRMRTPAKRRRAVR
jgi:DNA-binding NarL/FixJ family response regulator